MNSRGKKLAALLAGGAVLASGAYGIGTQTGGGGASAAGSPERSASSKADRDHPGRFDSDALAKKLGVDHEKLIAALDAIRGEMKPPEQRGDGFATDLAKALGVPEDKVAKALEGLRPGKKSRHRTGFATDLATELGIEASKARSVFRELRGARRGGDLSPADVAKKLGVSESKLEAALERLRPERGRGRGRGSAGSPPTWRGRSIST